MSQKQKTTQADFLSRKTNNIHSAQPPKGYIRTSTLALSIAVAFFMGLYLGTIVPTLMDSDQAIVQSKATAANVPAANAPVASQKELSQIELAEQAVENAPENVSALITLGNLYYDAQMPAKSVLAYTRALTINPNNPNVLTDRGTMYRAMGKYEQALDSYRKAFSLDPEHQNSLFNAGIVLYFDLRRKDEAREMFEKLLTVNPSAKAPNGQSVVDLLRELQ